MYNIKIIIWKLVSSSIFWKLFLYDFENKKQKSSYQLGSYTLKTYFIYFNIVRTRFDP